MRKHSAVLFSVLLGLLTSTSVAAAHYEENGRWAFGSVTRNLESGTQVDPVNLFLYPYGLTYDPNKEERQRIEDHFVAHWKGPSAWKRSDEMSDPGVGRFRFCKGRQGLRFARSFNPGYEMRPNNFTGSGYRRVPGPYDDCRTRYHYRMWEDFNVHTSRENVHTERQSYAVGGMHYDKLKPKLSGQCSRTSCVVFPERLSHFTGQDWDTVEYVATQKMNKQRDDGVHRDHANRTGGHCYKLRWKTLPGSEGPFGSPTKISDGRLTRIAMSHCPK